MGSLRQTVSGDSHTSRTSSGISKMRHFTINLVVNIIGAILFLIMGIALIVGFALNQSIVEELQQAANFDNWNPFILCAGILALFTAGVFILGSWKEATFASGKKNKAVRETIYILGLGVPGSRPPTEGEDSVLEEISPASSIISIFGFGHDGTGKWTFAGRRPTGTEEKGGRGDNNKKEEEKEDEE